MEVSVSGAELQASASKIKDFIEYITQDWGQIDGNPMIELRCISQSRSINVARFSVDWIDEAVQHAEAMNKAKQNIYMCINPVNGDADIGPNNGAKDTDILAAFFQFADADDADGMNNILSFAGPKFTASVKTGTQPYLRGHAYWQLEEPVYNLDAWRDVQRSIAHSLQTDQVVVNPSRIMRVAGTVSWPNTDKKAKGYTPEVVTMRTEFSDDRDPVPFQRMMRAFPPVKGVTSSATPYTFGSDSSFQIDIGQQAMDRELAEQAIIGGTDWHNNVIKLVASYVSKGLTDGEIHQLTDRFTMDGYTVDDTRREVQQAINGARAKGWTPEPDPQVERMATQVPKNQDALNDKGDDGGEASWPTPVAEINEIALPKRRWVYAKHHIRKYVSVTASAGGIGKTSLTMVEGLAVATGRELLGEAVRETTNVWILNLEDPLEEMRLRLAAAMNHYKISHDDIKGRLFMDGEDTVQITLAAEGREGVILNEALLKYMADRIVENNIGLVIIDPFVSVHMVNENSNMAVQQVVSMLRRLARDTEAAVHAVHHVRKGNGEDATIDSVRGAGSLIGAARAARVINRITPEDAIALGVEECDALGIFRVDDGKANLAPPSDKAVYRRMQSVEIANGEHIGVATQFKLPDMFDGVTVENARNVQKLVQEAEANQTPYRASVQAANYVGHAVAQELNLDWEKDRDKAKIKAIVKKWIKTNVLKTAEVHDTRQGREVAAIIVGEQIRWDEI